MELKNEHLTLIIDETIMEPTSLKLNGVEFLYQKTNEWKKDFPTLFPICGLLIDNKFTSNGQEYHLNRHGFFREMSNWKLVDSSQSSLTFSFESGSQFLDVYPWEFKLTYQFTIHEDSLTIQTTVENLSDSTMSYSLGYHPAFLVQKNGVINFNKVQKLYTDSVDLKYLVRNPETGIEINQTKISDLDFTNSQFYWTTSNQGSSFVYEDDQKVFLIDLNDYLNNTFIIWSESNEADYVCFEPMNGHADYADRQNLEISQKDQIINLNVGHSQTHNFKVKLMVK